MLKTYRPTDDEIMEQARRVLHDRQARTDVLIDRALALRDLIGPPPVPFERPCYGTAAYALAAAYGWITKEEQRADGAAHEARRRRSLQTCHRHSLYERPKFTSPADTGAYVPEASARIENDRNLTDGARRCARKVLEETYRRNREGRALEITVSYLAHGLGRCRRTVQRYLRLLEREGYIGVEVVKGAHSRLCTGLVIYLLRPLFPQHHRREWPQRRGNFGATRKSQNYRFIDLDQRCLVRIPRKVWALKCMDGVFRSLMKTNALCEPAANLSG